MSRYFIDALRYTVQNLNRFVISVYFFCRMCVGCSADIPLTTTSVRRVTDGVESWQTTESTQPLQWPASLPQQCTGVSVNILAMKKITVRTPLCVQKMFSALQHTQANLSMVVAYITELADQLYRRVQLLSSTSAV